MNPLVPNPFNQVPLPGAAIDATLRHAPGTLAQAAGGGVAGPLPGPGSAMASAIPPPVPGGVATPGHGGGALAGTGTGALPGPLPPAPPAAPVPPSVPGAATKPAVTYEPTAPPPTVRGASYGSTPAGTAVSLGGAQAWRSGPVPAAEASPAVPAPPTGLPLGSASPQTLLGAAAAPPGAGGPSTAGAGAGVPSSAGAGAGVPSSAGAGAGGPSSAGAGAGGPSSAGAGAGRQSSAGAGAGGPSTAGTAAGGTASAPTVAGEAPLRERAADTATRAGDPTARAAASPSSPRTEAAAPRTAAGPIALPPSTPSAVTRWAIEVGMRLLDVPGYPELEPLGASVYTFLSGQAPPDMPARQAAVARQQADPLVPLKRLRDDVPASLDQAVHRLLALAPAERFPSVQSALDALERVLDDTDRGHRGAPASRGGDVAPAPTAPPPPGHAPHAALAATPEGLARPLGDDRPPPAPTSPLALSNLLPLLANPPPIPPAARTVGPAVLVVAAWLLLAPDLPPLEALADAAALGGLVLLWRRLHRKTKAAGDTSPP